MEDLCKQSDVEIQNVPQVDPVEGQQEIRAQAGPGGHAGQAYQAAVQPVIGKLAIVPTVWNMGIQMMRDTITKYSNQVMARHKLMFNMPSTNYSDWRKLAQELLEQAKHCRWDNYGAEQAALDAL